ETESRTFWLAQRLPSNDGCYTSREQHGLDFGGAQNVAARAKKPSFARLGGRGCPPLHFPGMLQGSRERHGVRQRHGRPATPLRAPAQWRQDPACPLPATLIP